jgi:hypothetical protein
MEKNHFFRTEISGIGSLSFFCIFFHPRDQIAENKTDKHHEGNDNNARHAEFPKQKLELYDLSVLDNHDEKQNDQDQDNDNFWLQF